MRTEELVFKLQNEVAALREETDLQRQSIIQNLSCQVAMYREALEEITEELENCYGRDTELTIKARGIINCPDSRQVVDAAQKRQAAIQNSYDATHHNERAMCADEIAVAEKELIKAARDLVDYETRTYGRSKYVRKLKRALDALEEVKL
ncbi:MAG TPA: hypothetical protein DCZ10_18420 [Pelotomaculum sp.]|jgi:hypothetical protein|nr:hypothetical protein [Pelotomaculum sp.]